VVILLPKIAEIPDMPELEFAESTHIYKLNGIIIPSVTTVLGPLNNLKYDGISEKTLENAAEKGSAVHKAIENFIEFGIEDIESEHRGYFDGFMKWWQEKKPEPVGVERRVYHRVMLYAGTVDLIAYIDGVLTLIDYKTTYAMNDMTFSVQLEGYSQALKSFGIQVQNKMILHLKKDGSYAVHEYPVNDPVRWRVFGSLKTVYDYIQSCK